MLGFKPAENRPRRTWHRGPLLIHASKTFDTEGFLWIADNAEPLGLPSDWIDRLAPSGGIIGQAELWDVSTCTEKLTYWPASVTEQDRRWFFGPYGLWLRNARELPFVPLRRQLGLFNVDEHLIHAG